MKEVQECGRAVQDGERGRDYDHAEEGELADKMPARFVPKIIGADAAERMPLAETSGAMAEIGTTTGVVVVVGDRERAMILRPLVQDHVLVWFHILSLVTV